MIRLVPDSAGGTPSRWTLAFARRSSSRWVNWLVPGRYKHVTVMGYVGAADTWVFIDVTMGRTDVFVARGRAAANLIGHYADGADLLSIDARHRMTSVWRVGFWCVPAVKHICGIGGGALRPDALWRDCVAQGAQIIYEATPATGLSTAPA